MMQYNKKIVTEITKQIPKEKNLLDYLMQLLALKRESAYRRINSQIPFTVNELISISKDLKISIDQLLDLKTNDFFPFDNEFNVDSQPVDIYSGLLTSDIQTMEKLLASNGTKITAVINQIPLRFLPYPSLFKIEYCHYLYSIGNISLISNFSDIAVPPQISGLYEKLSSCFSRLDNITCILDSMAFPGIIRKIEYYHRSKFISTEDVHSLQAELFELLESYESLLRTGKNRAGSDYTFYYSFLNLESNTIFLEYDDNFLLQLWIYPESPVVIKDNRMTGAIQRKWIDAKMRNSVLITKTNDTQQIELLRNIHERIKQLTIDN
jgi:hypothetical protein